MRVIHLLTISLCLLTIPGVLARADDDRATVRGILVLASNQSGETDRRLAPYEPNLRRILRFESYRFAGEGRAALPVPGKGSVSLGRGHKLEIETQSLDSGSLKAGVTWSDGRRSLMNMVLVLRRGVPAVLGGPSSGGPGGEVFAVIVIAE